MNVSTTPPKKLKKVIRLRLKGYKLHREGKIAEANAAWKLATEIEYEDIKKIEDAISSIF